MDTRLLLVTQSGSVDALYYLIKEDPNILENVDGLPFINTPLHEASATNSIELAMELMILKPSFAKNINADGYSPLHISVVKQHVELALELVKCDPTLVRIRGRGGLTPLHLVAKKGGVDLLTEFLRLCPESIQDVNVNGETALHIMVFNDRYEELEVLTGWLQRMRKSDAAACVLNRRDREGNTALHLAASLNNGQVAKQLLRCMSLNRNIMNKSGKTALDVILENGDQANKDTKKILTNAGVKKAASLSKVDPASILLRKRVLFKEYCRTEMARYRSQMSDGTRNSLLVITGLVIQSTYQNAVQEREKYPNNWGEAILTMLLLWVFNTVAFYLAIGFTFILLPEGRSYRRWYLCCMAPVIGSFLLSVYMNANFPIQLIVMYVIMYLILIFGLLMYLLVFYVKWKKNMLQKEAKPKSELNVQVFKSEDNGVAV